MNLSHIFKLLSIGLLLWVISALLYSRWQYPDLPARTMLEHLPEILLFDEPTT